MKKMSKLTDLREILRYVPRFREQVFVVALDGAVIAHPNFANLLLDIALLRSLNIRVVLVHGAGHQLQTLAQELNKPISDHDGTGPVDAATLDLAVTAAHRATHDILEGLTATGLRGANANAVSARPRGILGGVDYQFTGRIERVEASLLLTLLSQDIIPLVSPLGFDRDGQSYRLNSDSVAIDVAGALGAIKLIFVTSYAGIVKGGVLLRHLSVAEAEQALAERGELAPEMITKLEHGLQATRTGVRRVHIIDGRVDEGLLAEIFSNEGIGTLIYANEYESIRRAKRTDVGALFSLMERSVQREELVARSQEQIAAAIDDYFVLEIDANPVACVALHEDAAQRQAELACLCVSPAHENQGLGQKLVRYAEQEARQRGCQRIVCLSTQAVNFFCQKAGYREGGIQDLPAERRRRHEAGGRRARVLVKDLGC